MEQIFFSFSQLFSLTIAHTDTGNFLINSNTSTPEKQFLMPGIIKKTRAGLFFIQIEDKSFTTHKNSKFEVGQEVACVVEPKIQDNQIKDFLVVGLEKIHNKDILKSPE
ncbi:hypothetical protein K9M74_01785 [Candidatus Woesearchaeota archaeon]|nr:hypothetical protein [Candidatus Woesearchaeota archaeon]